MVGVVRGAFVTEPVAARTAVGAVAGPARPRAAVGVVGRFELGPARDALRASHLSVYPAVALAVLGGVDGLIVTALVVAASPAAASLGLANFALFAYLRVAAAAGAGLLVLRVGARHRVALAAGVLAAAGLAATSGARNAWAMALAVLLAGAGSGWARTTHLPLLFDHYRPEVRVRAVCGYAGGVMTAAALASSVVAAADALGLTWRAAFLGLAGFAALGVLAAARLTTPDGGRWEQRAIDRLVEREVGSPGGQPDAPDAVITETTGRRFRRVAGTRSAGRLLVAVGAFGAFLVTTPAYLLPYWEGYFRVTADRAAVLYALLAMGSVIGVLWFGRQGELSFRADPARMLGSAARAVALGAVCLVVGTSVRVFPLMVALLAVAFGGLVVLLPAATVALLAVVRPTDRPHASLTAGLALTAGGIVGNPLVQAFAKRYGPRWGFAVLAVAFLACAQSLARAGRTVGDDIDDAVDPLVEQRELRTRRSRGEHLPLLRASHVDFAYGPVQVLFDVTFTVDDGEMVALLGTNGAGKSTLLRTISGISVPSRGTITFRGAEITHAGPDQRVKLGISQVPGGRAVFGPMTVVENLRVFGYAHGRDRRAVEAGIDAGFAAFPALARCRNQPAATLSGGEQQMLGIAKAFVVRPRVLLIDELSLGLAPLVVGELLDTVRAINAAGAAVVLVEQSVNIALSLVDHAYFMEKGEIRFDGHAADLAGRPDLLRSVFLEGASR